MAKPLGRGKGALLGAGLGTLRGLATGQGLGAALGGALAGGIAGGISPKNVRAQQFDMFNKPKILERFAMEDADRQAQRQAQQDASDAEYKQAQIGALNRSNLPEPRPPQLLNTPRGTLDPATRRIIPGTEPLPARPSQADEIAAIAARLEEELGTVEEESIRSLEGRREMLKKHLTPDEKRIIEGRVTDDDDPQIVARAQAKWAKIQDDELSSIRRVTGEKRKTETTRRRTGKGQPAQGSGQPQKGSGISRPRSQFNSSKFPGMNFNP